MIKSGALYYAVFLSFLIALISGFFILYTYFYNFFIAQQLVRDQVIANTHSAINLFCKDPEMFKYNETTKWKPEGGNENEIVEVVRMHWGSYGLVYAKAGTKNFKYQKVAITGDDFAQKEQYALYLADKKKYLSVSGNTKLTGDCYLPKLGIKRAYIEGQGYKNKELVFGEIRESKAELPKINYTVEKWIEPYLTNNYPKTDSVVFFSETGNINKINNSFNNKTLLLLVDNKSGFPRIPVSGNVIIHSDKKIHIPNNALLNDVIVVAPEIIIEKGFKGTLQVFATQNIQIQDNCLLQYPSFVGLYCTKSDKNISLDIGSHTSISGGVLLLSSGSGKKEPIIVLKENSLVQGIVYSSETIQDKGRITGTLCCGKFMLRTASSIYENHLLNCVINRKNLNTEFAGPFIIDDTVNQKIIKWVN